MSTLSEPYAPLTINDFLKGRDNIEPLTDQMKVNMETLLTKVSKLLSKSKLPYYGISSGYRPASINKSVGGAKRSAHMACEAIDLRDPNGALDKWCTDNVEVLVELGLYLESPSKTPGWCHIQIRPTKNRIFLP